MKSNSKPYPKKMLLISICLLLLILFSTSGCATNGFMGFGDPLTTTSYVDNSAAAASEETSAEFARLRSEIEELNALKNEMQSFVAQLERNKEDTAALQSMAIRVSERLEEMPTEMLRQLVEALQTYLEAVENQ